ncbi:MAG: hypothetical protein E7378_02985 [Clostridiales bacterium]|nr:hypothetical protein [Clostridiales bacterium]
MKKSIKQTAAMVLAVATTAGVAGGAALTNDAVYTSAGTQKVAYAEQAVNGYLTISNYAKTVKLFNPFTLPTALLDGTTEVENFTVTTPTGETFNQEDPRISNKQFTVTELGTYKIAYTSGTYVGEVTFEVVADEYNIAIEQNSTSVLPNKVAVDFVGDLYVPEWNINDLTAEELEEKDISVVMTLTTPDAEAEPQTIGADRKITFAEGDLEVGYYIVSYTAYQTVGGQEIYLASTQVEFQAVDAEVYENEFDLVVSYSSEKPATVNVGKTVKLPAVTAKNKTTNESVPVTYEVKVYRNSSDEAITDPEVATLEKVDGVYEFTAKQIGGSYRVEYIVKDALGNQPQQAASFIIDNVVDNLAPTPIVVGAYDIANAAGLKDESHALKSIFGMNDNGVYIKAMYAEDLGTKDYADYTFERRIENSSREEIYKHVGDANKEIVFNYTGDALDAEKYITVSQDEKKLSDGTYYVYYTVTDAQNNKQSVSYKFVVDDDFDWKGENDNEIKPTVEFNDTFYSSMEAGEKITFGKVTASDEKDARPLTEVFYQYKVGGTYQEAVILELNEDDKYVIYTKNNEEAKEAGVVVPEGVEAVKITAKATNDGGKFTEVSEEIEIYSEKTGEATPTIYSVGTVTNNLVQGQEIQIPEVVFQDGADDLNGLNASITVTCKTADGETISYEARNAVAIRTGNYYYYSGAKFVAATAGEYQVAVKATDAAGNVVIKFFNYTVNSANYTAALRFANLGLSDTDMELGDTYKLVIAQITGENSGDYTYEVRCVEGPTGAYLTNSEFKPTKVGTYKLRYVMLKKADATEVESEAKEFTITVKDTKGPQLNLQWMSEGKVIRPAYAKGTKLLLPKFSASDVSGIDTEKSNINISSNKTNKTIKYKDMNGKDKNDVPNMEYTFNYNAEYTITYTAYDLEGNSSKIVKTIKIGDLVAPVLVVDDDITNNIELKLNSEFTIDLSESAKYITAHDEKDTELTKADVRVELWLAGVKQDKVASTDTSVTYKFDKAGEYELKFILEDDANNKTEVVKTLTIKEETKESMSTQEKIGAILIAVSVVVLAGVVVYFIVSKRKMDKIYK